MKKIVSIAGLSFAIAFFCIQNSYAKTLVKYEKNTGNIIQTNNVDEIPSDEILNDRFKSDTTDILLYDGEVNIATQRVDLDKKTIKDISKDELDKAKVTQDGQLAKKKALKEKLKSMVIGRTVDDYDKLIEAVNCLIEYIQ